MAFYVQGVIEERSDIHAISYVGKRSKKYDRHFWQLVFQVKKERRPDVISLLPVLVVFVARQV